MNRVGRAVIMFTIGAVMARLLYTGGFGWFVQQRMRLPLLGATVVLLVFGVYEAIAGTREENENPSTIRRSAGPAVGWLLLLPLMVLISVAPTGLGAAAADRVDAFVPTEAVVDRYVDLDTSAGPPQLQVRDFLDRAIWDEERSLEDVTVQLEGLVVNDPELDDAFKLTRFMVSCCAADGIPIQVTVHHSGELPDDTWVVADVVWRAPTVPYRDGPAPWIIEADALSLTIVPDSPTDPYESP